VPDGPPPGSSLNSRRAARTNWCKTARQVASCNN